MTGFPHTPVIALRKLSGTAVSMSLITINSKPCSPNFLTIAPEEIMVVHTSVTKEGSPFVLLYTKDRRVSGIASTCAPIAAARNEQVSSREKLSYRKVDNQ